MSPEAFKAVQLAGGGVAFLAAAFGAFGGLGRVLAAGAVVGAILWGLQ